MDENNGVGGTWRTIQAIYFGAVAGTRWLILIAVGVAALLAAIFGGLWEAVVIALLGFELAQVSTRWQQIDADERVRRRELEAHERQRDRDRQSQEEQRKREIEAAQRQQKIVVYNTFANAIYDTILTPIQLKKLEGKPYAADPIEQTKSLMEVSKGLTMWGSDEVVKYYAGFMQRLISAHDKGTELPIFDEFADFFLELRRDAGYSNEGIARPDLFRLFGIRVPRPTSVVQSTPTEDAA